MPDWKSPETLERLVGAIIASITANGGTINNNEIAIYMGETYDSIENRTRKYKKDAQKLIKEAFDAGRQGQNMRKNAKDNTPHSTPRKIRKNNSDLHTVANGRVQKTATKRTSPVKHESVSGSSSDLEHFHAIAESFNFEDLDFSKSNFDSAVGDMDDDLV
ncbi:hypothetical protein MBLNU459_g5338t1 [Dothideomycetes sp. NU459]